MAKQIAQRELASYRQAYHDYEILETLEAGIALVGTEVKSLRNGGGSLKDNYIDIRKMEAYLVQAHIAHYKFGNLYNHEEARDRKLLLHKSEILKLQKYRQQKGLTLVALSLYLKNGRVKVKIAVCRGKKRHDKRASLKEKASRTEVQKALEKR